MPITRRRITLPGVKPIQTAKPGYEYSYLHGAVEPDGHVRQDRTAVFHRTRTAKQQLLPDLLGPVCKGISPEPRHDSGQWMILDNGRFHKAKKLSIPTGVQLKFLPPYSPELNPVERLWQDLKDDLGFDFYEHLADLRQKARTVLSRYTDEAVASMTGYDYLLEAASVGLS